MSDGLRKVRTSSFPLRDGDIFPSGVKLHPSFHVLLNKKWNSTNFEPKQITLKHQLQLYTFGGKNNFKAKNFKITELQMSFKRALNIVYCSKEDRKQCKVSLRSSNQLPPETRLGYITLDTPSGWLPTQRAQAHSAFSLIAQFNVNHSAFCS